MVKSKQNTVQQTKPAESTREAPEGFTLEQEIIEAEDEAVFLFENPVVSDAPRNVYREAVTNLKNQTKDYIWWHCENSDYVGRERIEETKPNQTRPVLKGYKYSIPYTKENRDKIISLGTSRTNYYKKEGELTLKLIKPEQEF